MILLLLQTQVKGNMNLMDRGMMVHLLVNGLLQVQDTAGFFNSLRTYFNLDVKVHFIQINLNYTTELTVGNQAFCIGIQS